MHNMISKIRTSSSPSERAGLMIDFHALLHREWKFDHHKGHRICIYFGHSWLGDWQKPAVVMEVG